MTLAEVLHEEFEARKVRNARYSLRAFARDLRIDPSNLSKLMAGKRTPANSVIEHLKKVTREHHPSLHSRLAKVFVRTAGGFFDFHPIEDYQRLLQWQNILVFEGLKLRNPSSSVKDLHAATGLSESQITAALGVLVDFGLAKRDAKPGRFQANLKHVSTGGESAQKSEAFRAYQRQLLERAAHALGEGSHSDRSQTSTVFCVEKSRLPQVQKRITAFRRSLAKLLDGGPSRNDGVYALCVSLFPLK